MNKKMILAVFAAVLAVGGLSFQLGRRHGDAPESAKTGAKSYYCPMHPEYTADRPGDCPICNMSLVPREEGPAAAPPTTLSGKRLCVLHKCTMANCKMEMPLKPGESVSCPVCGTHVAEPVKKGEPLYYRHPMRPEISSPIPKKDEMGMDYIAVYEEEAKSQAVLIPEDRRRLIGMTTGEVSRKDLAVSVRASGRVAYDPDLFNAISEYRAALRAREQIKASPYADAKESGESLVHGSALRLRQMGLSAAQIDALGKSQEPPTNLLLGGEGGSVWVYAQIYEYEIGLIKPGQSARITTPAYPGESFRGVVRAIDPILDAQSRSLKARIEVPNLDAKLKLEMFVEAEIQVPLGKKLAVPESAVLDSGTRQLVFVDLGDGRVEPREVKLGRQAGESYEVLSGLRESEKVVTSANFLVDSESRLKSAIGAPKKDPVPAEREGAKPAPAPEHRH